MFGEEPPAKSNLAGVDGYILASAQARLRC